MYYSHQELGDSGRSRRSSGIHVSGKTGWYRFSVLVVSDGRLYYGDNWMVERRDLAGIIVRRFFVVSHNTLWVGSGYWTGDVGFSHTIVVVFNTVSDAVDTIYLFVFRKSVLVRASGFSTLSLGGSSLKAALR